jgi:leucyl aminopeptidase
VVTTDFLGESAGAHDSLLVADVDGDGRTEVMLNAGTGGLLVFEFAGGPDTGPPTVALTAPSPGALLEGVVALQATASDDWAVERVEFLVDGAVLGTDFQEPYSLDWDTVPFDAGPHVLEARARDGAGHEATSAPVAVTVKDATGDAAYDPRRKAPTCPKPSTYCDSGALLVGRRQLGPEPNFPNAVNGSCWDGWAGGFHYSGSNDRIRVSTLDGSTLSPGKRARIEAWVFGGPRTPLGLPGSKRKRQSGWKLDLFASASDSTPVWFHVATIATTTTGLQKLTAEYTLPAGRLQVVRARYRYYGRVSPCDWSPWDDHDDLVFTVK